MSKPLLKVIGLLPQVISLGATVVDSVDPEGAGGRTITPTEAANISTKAVGLILSLAGNLTEASRKNIAAALRAAASELEAGR